ncbi:16825_t:CDS:2, partial [Funneliformis geosporum]
LSGEFKEALSHRTEVIEDNSQLQAQKGANPIVDSKIACDIKTVNNVNDRSILEKSEEIVETVKNVNVQNTSESSEEIKSKVDQVHLGPHQDKLVVTARSQIYAEMKPYLTGISDGYLRVITSKARKINKLFGYEYDPVTLKRIDGIPGYMVQRITCSADKISRLTNPQIEYIVEQVKMKTTTSPVNEISETVATTSANDSSDDNFSDTSDITDYFKEEGANDSAKSEEDSKKSAIIAKTDNDDDV